jgi:membrane-associated phospholipid phosphatase
MYKHELLLLIAATISSGLIMCSVDKLISDYMRESPLHDNTIINIIMRGGDMWGYVSIFLSLLMYIILENKGLGLNTLKSTLIGCTIARGLSVITGRARPFASPNNSMNFNLFKGIKYSLSSLPSGHSTVAFAFAAAADKSTSNSKIKTVLLYSMAFITAISRVYHDKHWLSDVIMGSTLGYLIGSKI